MNINKLFFLTLLLISVYGIKAQDLGNLVPKEAHHIGRVDLNKFKSKQGFTDLAKLPMFEELSLNIGKELFKDTTNEKSSKYIDLSYYGINTSSQAYLYANSDSIVFYGAMVVALNNQEAFFNFVNNMIDSAANPIQKLNNTMLARVRDLRIIWNNQHAAFWTATVLPLVGDSIRRSLEEKYGNNYGAIEDTEPAVEYAAPEADTAAYDSEEPVEEISADEYAQEENVTEEAYNEDGNEQVSDEEVEVAEEDSYDEPEEPYYDTYYMKEQICDSILNVWCAKNQETFLTDKGVNSSINNLEFKALIKNNPDAAFIIDYGQFMSMYMQPLSMLGLGTGYESMLAKLMNIYTGIKAYITIDFNKDDISAKCDFKYSESLNEVYKEVKKKKISPMFFPYLNKDMMGYLALGIDIRGISKGMGNYMRKNLPLIPEYGDMAVSALDLINIVVDEERLYKIFTGDVVMAINDVKSVQVIHTGYDFDEEYNKIETVDTTMQERPEMLIMMGVGNNDDVSKIFQILTRSKLLKPIGNYYGLAKDDVDFPVYFRVMNNILFISNNSGYIENPTVYATNARLGKQHTAMFKKNVAVFYSNLDKISKYFVGKDSSIFHNSIVEASGNFSEFSYTGSIKKKDRYTSNYVLKLKETNDNSFVDLFKFFNSIYLDKEKEKNSIIYE
jgi:hypothetical protein